MKILKSSMTLEDTCKHCQTLLELEPADIQVNTCGHPYMEYYTCPVCRKAVSMDGRVPKSWYPIIYRGVNYKPY